MSLWTTFALTKRALTRVASSNIQRSLHRRSTADWRRFSRCVVASQTYGRTRKNRGQKLNRVSSKTGHDATSKQALLQSPSQDAPGAAAMLYPSRARRLRSVALCDGRRHFVAMDGLQKRVDVFDPTGLQCLTFPRSRCRAQSRCLLTLA